MRHDLATNHSWSTDRQLGKKSIYSTLFSVMDNRFGLYPYAKLSNRHLLGISGYALLGLTGTGPDIVAGQCVNKVALFGR